MKQYLKVFRLFGYEVEIKATPIFFLDEAHKIHLLIEEGKFDTADSNLNLLIKRYGHIPEFLACGATLRFKRFMAGRKR